MLDEKTGELEAKLSYTFKDRGLLLQALTHKSYANERRTWPAGHNERLEFLGDTVLDFIVSDIIMRLCQDSPEGEMSKLRAVVVSETNLAKVARGLGLGNYLQLGKGEEQTGGRDKPSLVANALEAVIAAMYMDGGLDEAYRFIRENFEPDIRVAVESRLSFDYKTELQEACQSLFGELPKYTVVDESGPDHQKVFEVEIEAGGRVLGRGSGRSKKEAEQRAAGAALDVLKNPA
ncbi:MAG TPA: ribonuclease III [Nitrospirota bacterium]|nr:ribonuclease III [Nitrospirota bacterium]